MTDQQSVIEGHDEQEVEEVEIIDVSESRKKERSENSPTVPVAEDQNQDNETSSTQLTDPTLSTEKDPEENTSQQPFIESFSESDFPKTEEKVESVVITETVAEITESEEQPISVEKEKAVASVDDSDLQSSISQQSPEHRSSLVIVTPSSKVTNVNEHEDSVSSTSEEDEEVEEDKANAIDSNFDSDGEFIDEREREYRQHEEEFKNRRAQMESMYSMKDIRARWRKLREQFVLNRVFIDDTESILIDYRINEVQSMCRYLIHPASIIHTLPQPVQDNIHKYNSMTGEEFTRQRRKNWKRVDLLCYAFRMVRLLSNHYRRRRHYKQIEEKVSTVLKRQAVPARTATAKVPTQQKCSIGRDLLVCLNKRPEYRTPQDIKKIRWFLKSTEAFTHLLPDEMEEECALRVGYEQYDNGRVFAEKGLPPNRFYYVIGGKIIRLRHYKLFQGEVSRFMGYYKKGMTTDPEEMENQTKRECMLICKGQVEVLVLHKFDYFKLIKYGAGPPLDFLRKIALFRDFPCDQFLENPDAINLRYFGRGKTVVEDSAFTSWIHIVKSGSVKVVRRQTIYQSEPKRMFRERDVAKLGAAPFKGHADAMLGVEARQRRFKTHGSTPGGPISFPHITGSMVHQTAAPTKMRRSSTLLTEMLRRKKSQPSSAPIHEEEEVEEPACPTPAVTPDMEIIRNSDFEPQIIVSEYNGIPEENEDTFIEDDLETDEDVTDTEAKDKEELPSTKRKRFSTIAKTVMKSMRISSPLFRIPRKESITSSSPFGTYISTAACQGGSYNAEQEIKDKLSTVLTGRRNRSRAERSTHIQLDKLRPLDAFGFYKIAEWKGNIRLGKKTGLALVSEGAEVIRISKRFFLQVVENDTLLKTKDYLSQGEVKQSIEDKKIWETYKSTLIQRMVEMHT